MTWIRRLPKTRTRRLSRGKESLKDYFFEDLQKNSQKTYLFLSFFVTLHSSIETDTALQATSPIDFVREIPMLIISEYVKKRTMSLINQ